MRYAIVIFLLFSLTFSLTAEPTLQEELQEIFQELRTGLTMLQTGQEQQQTGLRESAGHLIDLNSSFLDYQVETDNQFIAQEQRILSLERQLSTVTFLAGAVAVVTVVATIAAGVFLIR